MMLKRVAENIKTMRLSRQLTQRELAKRLGISSSTIAMWETAKREPDFESLEALADEFNVPLASITGEPTEQDLEPISEIKMHRVKLLGAVAAGEPIDDKAFPDEYVHAPMQADFALLVKGDSMVPTYLEGDIVYCKSCPALPYDGAVVVLRTIDGECCIKHAIQTDHGVVIMSDNPAYTAKLIPPDLQPEVVGIPVGYTRMYEKNPPPWKG